MILDRLHEELPDNGPPTSSLIIWREELEGEVVLHLEGDLDLAGGGDLAAAVAALRTGGRAHITVDATVVRFIDLRGYRALMASTKAAGPSGDVPTVKAGEAVEHLRTLARAARCQLPALS